MNNADAGYSIGESAKNALHTNPKNTVFDAKRLIGRQMSDKDLQKDIKHWPFLVKENAQGKPSIQVSYNGEAKEFVRLLVHFLLLLPTLQPLRRHLKR